MVNFAREVFVCVCPTNVPKSEQNGQRPPQTVSFHQGVASDIERLDPEHHSPEYLEDLPKRLEDHYWLVGEIDNRIVTYTWLHKNGHAEYRFLTGCGISMDDRCGYGFDAWTPPDLRGQGLRRVAFLEELMVLNNMGCDYEASFFVKHQLEGATRSLASVGIDVIPVWKVNVNRDKSFRSECLNQDLSKVVKPVFPSTESHS